MNIFRFKNLLLCILLGATGIVTADDSVATASLISPDTSITTIRDIYEKPIVKMILEKAPAKKRPSQLATMFNHYWATHAPVIKDWYVASHNRVLSTEEAQVQSLIEEITLKEWTFEAYNYDETASVPFITSSVNLFDAVDATAQPIFRTKLITGMLDIFALNTAATQKQATPTMNRLVKNLQEIPYAAQYQADISTLAAGLPEFKLNELPWLNARKAAAIAGAVTVAATTAFCGKKLHTYIKSPRPATPPVAPPAVPARPGAPAPAAPTPAPAPADNRSPMERRADATLVDRALGRVEDPTLVERAFNAGLNNEFGPRVRREIEDLVHVTPLVVGGVAGEIQHGLETFITDPERVVATTTTGLRWAANAAPYYFAKTLLGIPGLVIMGVSDAMSSARNRIQDPPAIPALPAAPAPTADITAAHAAQEAARNAIVTRNNQLRTRFGVASLIADKARMVSCATAVGYNLATFLPWIASYATGSDIAYWMTLGTEIAVPTFLAVTNRARISQAIAWIGNRQLGGQTVAGFLGNVWTRFTNLDPDTV